MSKNTTLNLTSLTDVVNYVQQSKDQEFLIVKNAFLTIFEDKNKINTEDDLSNIIHKIIYIKKQTFSPHSFSKIHYAQEFLEFVKNHDDKYPINNLTLIQKQFQSILEANLELNVNVSYVDLVEDAKKISTDDINILNHFTVKNTFVTSSFLDYEENYFSPNDLKNNYSYMLSPRAAVDDFNPPYYFLYATAEEILKLHLQENFQTALEKTNSFIEQNSNQEDFSVTFIHELTSNFDIDKNMINNLLNDSNKENGKNKPRVKN